MYDYLPNYPLILFSQTRLAVGRARHVFVWPFLNADQQLDAYVNMRTRFGVWTKCVARWLVIIACHPQIKGLFLGALSCWENLSQPNQRTEGLISDDDLILFLSLPSLRRSFSYLLLEREGVYYVLRSARILFAPSIRSLDDSIREY